MSPTASVLLGSFATAFAIFGGGLAVEAYKRRNDRAGMALVHDLEHAAHPGLRRRTNKTAEL